MDTSTGNKGRLGLRNRASQYCISVKTVGYGYACVCSAIDVLDTDGIGELMKIWNPYVKMYRLSSPSACFLAFVIVKYSFSVNTFA